MSVKSQTCIQASDPLRTPTNLLAFRRLRPAMFLQILDANDPRVGLTPDERLMNLRNAPVMGGDGLLRAVFAPEGKRDYIQDMATVNISKIRPPPQG